VNILSCIKDGGEWVSEEKIYIQNIMLTIFIFHYIKTLEKPTQYFKMWYNTAIQTSATHKKKSKAIPVTGRGSP
jgi:hypothetical protein